MFVKDNIRKFEYSSKIGKHTEEKILLFNKTKMTEDEAKEKIQLDNLYSPDTVVVTKEQFENVFESEEEPMCDCVKQLNEDLKEKYHPSNSATIPINFLNGQTFTEYEYETMVGKRKYKKRIFLAHTHCPFCGRKYPEKNNKKEGDIKK